MTDPLSAQEIDRYRRHIVLAEIGGSGQQRLKAANVLIIGAGGLGAPVIQYLAAAGIGHIGVADDDTVSLSNLQRQVIHDTAGLGMPKIESAEAAVSRLNPHVLFSGIASFLVIWLAYALIYRWPSTRLTDYGVDAWMTRLAWPGYRWRQKLRGKDVGETPRIRPGTETPAQGAASVLRP